MNEQVKTQVPGGFRGVAIADHGGGGKLMPQTFGEVVSFAEVMSKSQHAIPKHLRDVPGACMAVAMQALRWEMDPFAVASKSYNVKDIIAYEAQLIAAVVNTRAPLETAPEYEYTGEGADRRCKVWAVFKDGKERSYESPRIADIAVKNSPLWKADPDQQLGYYSIRAFARRYCPEVILGVYTPEEAGTFHGPDYARDVTPRQSLQERFSATPGVDGAGFSQQHVITEIDGETDSNSSSAPPPPVPAETNEPASDVSPMTDAGNQSRSESGADDLPLDNITADHGVERAAGRPVDGRSSTATSERMDETAGETAPFVSALPQGWAIVYAAALRRAQKVESLARYDVEFWRQAQYGPWTKHKDTPDGELAIAIYTAFKDHFGDKEAIDDTLRELI